MFWHFQLDFQIQLGLGVNPGQGMFKSPSHPKIKIHCDNSDLKKNKQKTPKPTT